MPYPWPCCATSGAQGLQHIGQSHCGFICMPVHNGRLNTYNFRSVISLRRFKPLTYNLFSTRRLYNYAFQILLTASVMPTSFVSNSYNETPTNIVVTRSV